MSLLELGDTKIEGDVRLLRTQSQRLTILGRSLFELPLLRECDSQVAMDSGVVRIALFQLTPQYFSIGKLTRLHEV
jgi:hypothetical protein